MAATDIRVLVPRVRRAVEGVGQTTTLTDDDMKNLVADAISDILLLTGSVFGKDITVVERENGVPQEYETNDELTLPEGSVIAAQAALTHFFQTVKALKTHERMGDEAVSWEYDLSPTLLVQQLKLLQTMRDEALAAIGRTGAPLESYVSFLAVRDAEVSREVEPYVCASGAGGLEQDWRFGA